MPRGNVCLRIFFCSHFFLAQVRVKVNECRSNGAPPQHHVCHYRQTFIMVRQWKHDLPCMVTKSPAVLYEYMYYVQICFVAYFGIEYCTGKSLLDVAILVRMCQLVDTYLDQLI